MDNVLKDDMQRVIDDSETLENKMKDFLNDISSSKNTALKLKTQEIVSKNRDFIDSLKAKLKDIE